MWDVVARAVVEVFAVLPFFNCLPLLRVLLCQVDSWLAFDAFFFLSLQDFNAFTCPTLPTQEGTRYKVQGARQRYRVQGAVGRETGRSIVCGAIYSSMIRTLTDDDRCSQLSHVSSTNKGACFQEASA